MVKKQCCCPITGIVIGVIVVVISLIVEFVIVPYVFKEVMYSSTYFTTQTLNF